jgi:hypothetical protein
VEAGARAAVAIGRPFFAGVGTLGTALLVDAGGRPIAATTRTSLGRLAADRGLTVGRSVVLAGGNRQVTVFEAGRATRLGEQEVAPGQRIRAIRPTPGDLRELARRLSGLGLAHYRGAVYHRLPGPEERLSLPLAALAEVLRDRQPPPGLELTLTAGEGGRGSTVRVTLANRGDLPTGVALVENNFVEVRVAGGAIGAVDPGRFRRYTLERGGREAASMQDVNNADAVKLFAPAVDAGASVASGPIEVRGGAAEVTAGGRFLLASGEVYELPPAAPAAPGP